MLARFDAVHAAAALSRIPKLMRYRAKDLAESGVVSPRGSERSQLEPVRGALPAEMGRRTAARLARTLLGIMPQVRLARWLLRILPQVWGYAIYGAYRSPYYLLMLGVLASGAVGVLAAENPASGGRVH